jgi:hypothetical protein
MALFTAAAAATITAIKALTVKAVLTNAARLVFSVGASRLLAKRSMKKANSGKMDTGGRIQLPPATDNKIPVVYGSAFVGGPIIDAKISTDQKTMWYVVALGENTDTTPGSGYTFGTIYYDGKQVNFGTNGAVTGLVNNNQGTPEVDTKVNGNLFIYLFTNGSSSGTNTGGQTAIQILSDSAIPVAQRWTSNHTMTNCAFAIVKVIYNTDAGTTGLGVLTAQLTNSLSKPGDVIRDYMINTRYGCAIPLSRIDLDSLTDLNVYSDELISYVPVGGGSATQARYRINGPLDTSDNCLVNLQTLVDSCDSWLQYSELTGKWKVVINQSYLDYTTFNDLFVVNDDNLISGIQINPIDLNQTFNELEVAYPNKNIKDQADYQTLVLADYLPGLLSPNEAVNRLNIDLPVVNEAVQAKYVGLRRLLQSREDLIINFSMDYSGIQVEAGDVIRVNSTIYGWTNKLFRVMSVAEQNFRDNTLGVSIQAFEYNDTIYADNSIQDFVPAFNTGLTDPNIISQPDPPVLVTNPPGFGQIQSINVSGNVPATGTVLYMDFNYGFSSNVATHLLYRTISKSDGTPFTANETIQFDVNDAGPGTYYVSVTARNDQVGRSSNSSDPFVWSGTNITVANIWSGCNANSSGTLVTLDSIANLSQAVGGIVTITSGTGTLAANTTVANVISNTQFNLSVAPIIALSNACIQIESGGISGNNIQPNSISYTNLNDSADPQQRISLVAWGIADAGSNTVNLPVEADANVIYNSPIYLDGTTVPANLYNPYFQATSSTANGYIANSTGVWEPAGASFQILENGEDDWYVFIYDNFGSTDNFPLAPDEFLILNLDLVLVSDKDTICQIGSSYTTTSGPFFYFDNSLLGTYVIPANVQVNLNLNTAYNSSPVIDGGGFLIKNLVGNTRVYTRYAVMEMIKGRFNV